MSIYTGNFRRAVIAAAAAWAHAADAVDNVCCAEDPEISCVAWNAVQTRQAAEGAALKSLDATKFADRAYLKDGNDSVRNIASSAHDAYTIALHAADAAEASAKESA